MLPTNENDDRSEDTNLESKTTEKFELKEFQIIELRILKNPSVKVKLKPAYK